MLGRLRNILDSKLGIGPTTPFGEALLRERFTAIKSQLPWLYAVVFSTSGGLYIALSQVMAMSRIPIAILLGMIILRALHWLRLSGRRQDLADVNRIIRRTFMVAFAFCATFCVWALGLYWQATDHRLDIVMFASLSAVGACYSMTAFPAIARVPLLVLALPMALAMTFGQGVGHSAMGISLTILIMLTLHLLKLHDRVFVRLVESRMAVEAEKQRAIEAEKVAIDEQTRVGRIACTDPLTGLANRRGFMGFLEQLSGSGWKQALILFDLDGFKPINDTFGHPVGDAMLIEVSRRLQAVGPTGSVARLGGDEFAVLCDCPTARAAKEFAERAVDAISQPFVIDGRTMRISASAGLSFQVADQLSDAILRADVALYSAKRAGRGKVAVFSDEMQHKFQRRTSIEQALREPGLAGSIDLAFQPIFDLKGMRLHAFEALARWRHSELGWISPSEFIPITEQISLLEEMSDTLLRRAARAAGQWPIDVRLSFNLSAVQLCSPGTAAKLLDIIRQEGLLPDRLQIEVTETALLADFDIARQNLSELRANGVEIVLDDFGAGYSSISYLREMNFDKVKLDGSLISGLTAGNREGLPLLKGALALCDAMDRPCVAEHIETQQQLAMLTNLGCRFGQGYFLSPPIDGPSATQMAWQAIHPVPRSSAA